MKILLLPIIFLFLVFSNGNAQSAGAEMTAEEIFGKVIQYYDPNGVWDDYKGSMHLTSVFENSISKEELTIDNSAR